MDEKKVLEQEKNELNALINKGFTFDLEDYDIKVEKKFFGLIRKRKTVKVKKTFTVKELTLGTLDRISRETIDMAIDEESLKGKDGMSNARNTVCKQAERCAKVIALSVLDSDYLIPKKGGGYIEDVGRLSELTSLFMRRIKPSMLYQLYVLINAMSNLGDFLNSIRLMSNDRTTMPIRIEKEG